MSLESALAGGRTAALARMTSTAAIMRDTGTTTTDGNGYVVPVWATVYASIAFRLGGAYQGGSGSRTVRVGTTDMQLALRVGHLPVDTDLLQDGDLIEVTAGECAGLVLKIAEAAFQDQATARRVPVMEIQRPEEWA